MRALPDVCVLGLGLSLPLSDICVLGLSRFLLLRFICSVSLFLSLPSVFLSLASCHRLYETDAKEAGVYARGYISTYMSGCVRVRVRVRVRACAGVYNIHTDTRVRIHTRTSYIYRCQVRVSSSTLASSKWGWVLDSRQETSTLFAKKPASQKTSDNSASPDQAPVEALVSQSMPSVESEQGTSAGAGRIGAGLDVTSTLLDPCSQANEEVQFIVFLPFPLCLSHMYTYIYSARSVLESQYSSAFLQYVCACAFARV